MLNNKYIFMSILLANLISLNVFAETLTTSSVKPIEVDSNLTTNYPSNESDTEDLNFRSANSQLHSETLPPSINNDFEDVNNISGFGIGRNFSEANNMPENIGNGPGSMGSMHKYTLPNSKIVF